MYRIVSKVLKPASLLRKPLYKALVRTPQRYFGHPEERYSNLTRSYENFLPQEGPDYPTTTIERNEVETRILRVLSYFDKVDIKTFKFDQDLKKDLRLDSLETIALLTSIEQEFSTVFEDRVFDNFKNLEQVVNMLCSDLNTH